MLVGCKQKVLDGSPRHRKGEIFVFVATTRKEMKEILRRRNWIWKQVKSEGEKQQQKKIGEKFSPALVFAFTFALSANLVLNRPVVVYPPYTELERSGLAVLPPPPPPPP